MTKIDGVTLDEGHIGVTVHYIPRWARMDHVYGALVGWQNGTVNIKQLGALKSETYPAYRVHWLRPLGADQGGKIEWQTQRNV